MFDKIKALGKELTEKVDNTKSLVSDGIDVGKSKANDLVEKHWSTIEKVMIDGLITIAEDKLKDDAIMESLLDRAYQLLPIAIRFAVPQHMFIEISMKKREPLLLKLQEHKEKKHQADLESNHTELH
jgi:hypothetical protein